MANKRRLEEKDINERPEVSELVTRPSSTANPNLHNLVTPHTSQQLSPYDLLRQHLQTLDGERKDLAEIAKKKLKQSRELIIQNQELKKRTKELNKQNEDLKKSKEQLRKENEDLNKSKEQLRKENEDLNKSKEQLRKQNEQLDKDMFDVNGELLVVKTELKLLQNSSLSMKKRMKVMDKEKAAARRKMKNMERDLMTKNNTMKQRDEEITDLKSRMKQRDEEITDLKSRMKQRDEEIKDLKSRMKLTDEQIEDLMRKELQVQAVKKDLLEPSSTHQQFEHLQLSQGQPQTYEFGPSASAFIPMSTTAVNRTISTFSVYKGKTMTQTENTNKPTNETTLPFLLSPEISEPFHFFSELSFDFTQFNQLQQQEQQRKTQQQEQQQEQQQQQQKQLQQQKQQQQQQQPQQQQQKQQQQQQQPQQQQQKQQQQQQQQQQQPQQQQQKQQQHQQQQQQQQQQQHQEQQQQQLQQRKQLQQQRQQQKEQLQKERQQQEEQQKQMQQQQEHQYIQQQQQQGVPSATPSTSAATAMVLPKNLRNIKDDSRFHVFTHSIPNLMTGQPAKVNVYEAVIIDSRYLNTRSAVYTTPVRGKYRFGGLMRQTGSGEIQWYLCSDREEKRILVGTTDSDRVWCGRPVYWECEEGERVWKEVVRMKGEAEVEVCVFNGLLLRWDIQEGFVI